MHALFILVVAGTAVLVVLMIAAIAFGGPAQRPPMQIVNDPFRSIDLSGLPSLARFQARDGMQLACRAYGQGTGGARGCVVLIHGSSARSNSMHPLAQGLEAAGFIVYALDMRGHGESGRKGQIAQIGQLEDDLEDFIHAVRPAGPRLLVGFSAGGGFALRFAADARRRMFDAYLLLAPFLSQNASTYRPASGGWASVGLPRIFGLVVLNRLGFTGLNHLPVTAYSLAPEAEALLTPRYAYALAMNFRPHNDYQADIARANVPMEVLVGDSDDQFHADRFAAEFSAASPKVAVTIVPGVGHVGLTLGPSAIDATVQAATRLSPGVVPLRLS